MNLVSRGIRNAFRNVTRTTSIVIILGLAVGLCLVMLIAKQAVNNKIEVIKHSVGNTILVQPRAVGEPSSDNTLTDSQLSAIQKLSHITKLAENLTGRVHTDGAPLQTTASGMAPETVYYTNLKSPAQFHRNSDGTIDIGAKHLPANYVSPIRTYGTTDPTAFIASINTAITIKSGHAFDGTKDVNEVLVSNALATKNNLHVGSTFTAYGTTLKVVGIFASSTEEGKNYLILPLPTMQRLSNSPHVVSEAVATVDSITNIASATNAVRAAVSTANVDVISSEDTVKNAIKPLQSIQSVSLYSLAGAVIAGSTIILLTMIMVVRERKREIGVLKAIGSSNIRIMFQFMAEALTLTVLGAIIGLIIGVAGASPITKTLVDNSTSHASQPDGPNISIQGIQDVRTQIGLGVVLDGFGAALVIALVGSAVATLSIAKIKPAEVLRSE